MTSAEISNLDAALLYVVVDPKLSSRVIEAGKEMGIGGASVMRGRGTVRSGLLNALGIVDSRKEIVLMAGDMPTVRRVLDGLTQQFRFDQPNKGIAFAVRLTGVAGTDACASWTRREDRPVADAPGWKLIVTIVDEDVEEDVLESAQKAGTRGGTIVHAHGAGSAQTSKVFDMEIEPEKSLVFMLVPAAEASRVSQFIYRDLGLDRPNSGILYIHDLLQGSLPDPHLKLPGNRNPRPRPGYRNHPHPPLPAGDCGKGRGEARDCRGRSRRGAGRDHHPGTRLGGARHGAAVRARGGTRERDGADHRPESAGRRLDFRGLPATRDGSTG